MPYGAARFRPKWCGRGESNPHRHCCPTDFLTSYGFRRPVFTPSALRRVCGLDYPFAVAAICISALGAARLVSTPSPADLGRLLGAWLGIAI